LVTTGYAPWVKQYGDMATSCNIIKIHPLPITTENYFKLDYRWLG